MSKTETPDIVTMLRDVGYHLSDTGQQAYGSMMQQAAAEIERLRTELAKHQWRTMESAPRDGTSILAVICGRHPGTGRPFIPEVVSYNENGYWDNCMWVDDGTRQYDPTHWQPLPSPPGENE